MDCGEQPSSPAAVRTPQHVDQEHAPQQLGPRIPPPPLPLTPLARRMRNQRLPQQPANGLCLADFRRDRLVTSPATLPICVPATASLDQRHDPRPDPCRWRQYTVVPPALPRRAERPVTDIRLIRNFSIIAQSWRRVRWLPSLARSLPQSIDTLLTRRPRTPGTVMP